MISHTQKLRLAGALALCLPFAVQAQSNVTFYGKLYPQLNWMSTSGATAPNTPLSTLAGTPTGENMSTNLQEQSAGSRWGFRGSEKLGNGMTAIFQLEQTVAVDSGTGSIGTRDSFVGLQGGFGTIRLGNIDTPYKSLGDNLAFLGVSSANFMSSSNILSKSGIGTNSASSFHLRTVNTVAYTSPDFGPVSFRVHYSPDEAKTANRNAALVSTGVVYKKGPLYLALAHEIHDDYFGGSRNSPTALSNFNDVAASSRDVATRATFQYQLPTKTLVNLNYARKQYKETGGAAGRFGRYRNGAWAVNVQHTTGAVTMQASYAAASEGSCSLLGGAACSTEGMDGNQWNVGASYAFSKRTYLFGVYSGLTNGEAARYNNMTGAAPTPGADIGQLAFGLAHSF